MPWLEIVSGVCIIELGVILGLVLTVGRYALEIDVLVDEVSTLRRALDEERSVP